MFLPGSFTHPSSCFFPSSPVLFLCLVYEDSGVEEPPLAPSSLAFFLHFRWINSSSTANLNCWHLEVKGYQVVSLVHMKTPDAYFHLAAGSFMKVHYIPLYVSPLPYWKPDLWAEIANNRDTVSLKVQWKWESGCPGERHLGECSVLACSVAMN